MKEITKLVKYEIKEYLEVCDMDYEDMCERDGGKYVYSCESENGEDFGSVIGIEYENEEYEVVGCRMDRKCDFEVMLGLVWNSL